MVNENKLQSMDADARRQLLTNLNELRYSLEDYWRFQLEDDACRIECYSRLVINELKNILQ